MKSHLVEMLNKSIIIIMYYVLLLLLLSLLNRSKNKLAAENAMTRAIQRGSIFDFENLPWSNPCHTPPTFNGVAPAPPTSHSSSRLPWQPRRPQRLFP